MPTSVFTPSNLKGWATILLWSISALSIAYTPQFPPFFLAASTSLIGAILFSQRWITDRSRLHAALSQPWQVWLLFALAVVGYRGFYLSGLKMAPTIEANLIQYLWPILIVLLGHFVDRRKPTLTVMLSVSAGFLGVVLIALSKSDHSFTWHLTLGHLSALFAGIAWATYSVFTKKYSDAPGDMIGVMHIAATIFFSILHCTCEVPVSWNLVDTAHWIALLQLGIAISLGYSWWNEAMTKGSRDLMAVSAYFIPLLSTLLLILFGNDEMRREVAIAAGLILSGGVLARRVKT